MAQLSVSVGSTSPCACTRLARLAKDGLTCGPACNQRRRWNLTAKGLAAAASGNPVVLDQRDRDILGALVLTPMRQLQLVRRTGLCSLTVKRRLRSLIGSGLATQDAERQPFKVTSAGIAALGPNAPIRPAPWIDSMKISAANARDVVSRGGEIPTDDRTSWMRSRQGSEARLKAVITQRANKNTPFNAFPEFDRMTG